MDIGVLALQGAFAAHIDAVQRLGHDARELRTAESFAGLGGLILPGGESSSQLLLLESLGMWQPLQDFVASGRPVLGTCAGLILMSRRVSPSQSSLACLDVEVLRNGWGRQIASFQADSEAEAFPMVLIRAPRIVEVGPQVEILDTWRGEPVWVRQGACYGATFHPELTADLRIHRRVFGPAAP